MTGKLAVAGGNPVVTRADYKNWPIITADDRRLINVVLDSGIVAGGTAPMVSALEREWAEYVGTKHCLTTVSGTSALPFTRMRSVRMSIFRHWPSQRYSLGRVGSVSRRNKSA